MPPELRAASAEPSDDFDRPWQLPRRTAFLTWLLAILAPSAAFLRTPSEGEAAAIPVRLNLHRNSSLVFFWFRVVLARSVHRQARMLIKGVHQLEFSPAALAHSAHPKCAFLAAPRGSTRGPLDVVHGADVIHQPGSHRAATGERARAHFERFQERREQTPPYLLVEPSGGVIEVSTKYCTVCGIVRPPRASHCRETDRCIERWDHYCPWVGTAVGRRNYGWFVAFVLTSTLLALYVACASFAHLRYAAAVLFASERRSVTPHATPAWVRSALEAPISCLLVGYGLVVGAMLSVLSFYHLFLIATNQTT